MFITNEIPLDQMLKTICYECCHSISYTLNDVQRNTIFVGDFSRFGGHADYSARTEHNIKCPICGCKIILGIVEN